MEATKERFISDKLGITVSVICAVHCILTPLFLPLFLAKNITYFACSSLERYFLLAAVVIAGFSLAKGYLKYHGRLYPFLFLLAGILVCLNQQKFVATFGCSIFPVTGLIMALSHGINMWLCHACICCGQKEKH